MFNRLLYSTLSAAEIDARMQLWLIRTAPEQDFRQGLQIHGTCVNNCFELDFYYHYEVETIRYDGPYRVMGNVVEDNQTTMVT